MTSLISWVGVDNRGPASVYIASDSRLSSGHAHWDSGRKVFACTASADIFGYCGAVLFPSQLLGQLTQSIDNGILFPENARPQQRLEIVTQSISDGASRFPEQVPFTIAYATRDGHGFGASFLIATISWKRNSPTLIKTYPVPSESDLLFAYGSGQPVVDEFHFNWKRSDVGRTSRAVFSAFCEAVASGQDQYTGGAPQAVGIYLRGPSKVFGIIHNGQCYLNGMQAHSALNTRLECRNELFECCDIKGDVIGQRHSRPRKRQTNRPPTC